MSRPIYWTNFTSSLHDLKTNNYLVNFKNSFLSNNNLDLNDSQCVWIVSSSTIILIHHMSYLHHGFGPNHDGCKTPKLEPQAHKPIFGALTSNPRTPGLGVPPKLHKNQQSGTSCQLLGQRLNLQSMWEWHSIVSPRTGKSSSKAYWAETSYQSGTGCGMTCSSRSSDELYWRAPLVAAVIEAGEGGGESGPCI